MREQKAKRALLPDKTRDELVERTLKFAQKVTRELLPLTPNEALMLDVSTAQLKVMFILYLRGPQRIGLLAKRLDVSLPTMTVTVDRLVKRNIILRENDAADRRVVYCHLSDKGKQILNQLWKSATERTRQMLSVLSISELETVGKALEILLKAGQITRKELASEDN